MYCLQRTVVHINICCVATEPLCRQSRVLKSQVQLANSAIYYLCDNRDPINQGHAFFFSVFHYELTPFSDSQISKVSARPTVFRGTR